MKCPHCSCEIEQTRRVWMTADIKYLRENYGHLTNKQMAEKLGVSANNIKTKLSLYGISKSHLWRKL